MGRATGLTKGWRRTYYVVSGLLYPGALGTALYWFVLAANNIATGEAHHPSAWMMGFALWFTLYHLLLFARLIDSHQQWAGTNPASAVRGYDWWSFGSDLVDVVALFLAFAALGFQADTETTDLRVVIIFFAALMIPYSAVVARGKVTDLRLLLALLTTIVALVGIGLNFFERPQGNGVLLAVLWILLAIYATYLYPRD